MAAALMSLGGRGVEEKADLLTTYLEPPPDPDGFAARARGHLEAWTGESDVHLSWAWQLHEDWESVWRRGLEVRRVTDRIVVHPSWLDPRGGEGDVVIQLDPGMAFGTAEHGTTRGCLRLLDGLVARGERVLDIGCGSGILSIAAALLGATQVLALDLDPLACDAARENTVVNGVEESVIVEERRVTPDWLAGAGSYDGIVANLETHLILPLLPGLLGAVRSGGWIVLSGVLVGERQDVIREVGIHDGPSAALRDEDHDGEWWAGAFRLD